MDKKEMIVVIVLVVVLLLVLVVSGVFYFNLVAGNFSTTGHVVLAADSGEGYAFGAKGDRAVGAENRQNFDYLNG